MEECALCASSAHDVHHASVCVNVVIGALVVHCELHVDVRVHVIPLVVESFRVDFGCVHRFQLLNVCNQYVTLPNASRVQSVSEEQSRKDFLSKFMGS